MSINKVELKNGTVLLDVTDVETTTSKVLQGVRFIDNAGNKGIGEYVPQSANLGSVYIENNGTYEAQDSGLDGWWRVEVNVQGGGGGTDRLPSLLNRTITSISASDFQTNVVYQYSFNNCYMLSNVELPSNINSIDYGAFSGCTSLHSINLPGNLYEISTKAFESAGLESIFIPASVTYISSDAFRNCPLDFITVDSNNSVFNSQDNCNALIRTSNSTLIRGGANTVIPNSVTNFEQYAFAKSNIESIIIPDTVLDINEGCFSNCYSLTQITLSSSLTRIPFVSFYNCYNLLNITIPSNVSAIDGAAFRECVSLSSVVLEAVNPPSLQPDVFKYWNDQTRQMEILPNLTIYVPSTSVTAYQQDANWSEYASIIQADPNN